MTSDIEKDVVSAIGRPDPVILEIGCNDGTDTLAFLSLFPGAQICCFEPDPRAQERFRLRVRDVRTQLFPLAVGSSDGQATFYQSDGFPSDDAAQKLPQGWDLSGSIRRPKHHLQQHPWCTFTRQITVPLVRLDTWADAFGVKGIDFVWADVQGAERDLIEGGQKTLARTRFFFTEYNDQELYEGQVTLHELRRMLPNFEVVAVYPDDVLFRNVGLS